MLPCAQDVYIWIRSQLLNFQKIKAGSDLMLLCDGTPLPIKANTAFLQVTALPGNTFDCVVTEKVGLRLLHPLLLVLEG